ncbi:glutathione-disulfide reductase [Marinobacterium sp. xm-d-564]|uniref:glutathione-disulfide reductase n=1 Tax=Marinobacterium sp. xm-d-564 TaxID=2497742 RepID=UPI0015680681|nr:glutathione-disulfide reductase [Marinobacterium sp. xm-d-564]NRP59051.1 Glutathione amide reductase [Marinobacterium sp. xm-d-564]
MSGYDYDLFVIGAGSGGVRAARMAAAKGVRVAVAEDLHLGGTCVNVGCVPKKLYVYASEYMQEIEEGRGFGVNADSVSFDWATLRDNKKHEIARLNGIYGKLLDNSGCTRINGRATVTGPNSVSVNGETITAERILVAVGGWPFVPDIPGKEHAITSNEVFDLDSFPQRVMVVGGGYIAIEFAGIFAGLQAQTELVYRGDLFLRGFDQEVREFTATEVARKGIKLSFNTDVASIEKRSDGALDVTLSNGEVRVVDQILYATGRVPKTANLGLESAGVAMNSKGAIEVNDHFQSSVPSIYALGDVIDRVQLTPVALAEAMSLVDHLYGSGEGELPNYELIPTAVFCQPNIGTLGLTEEQARERFDSVDIYVSDFRAMRHTISGSEERTLMKLIVESATDKIVGIHMVGADAGEILQGLAVAVIAGATKRDFDRTIGIHPTAAEEFVTMRQKTR